MAATRDKLVSRLFVVAVLFFGAAIFALPFLDMVFTSVKLDDEMATENYRLLPKTPAAKWRSPYVATDFDNRIERPADMSRATWKELEEPFTETVAKGVRAWWEQSEVVRKHYAGVPGDEAIKTLTQTVGHRVLSRLSDVSRKAGVPAMLKEAAALTNDETIFPEFKTYVPRFALGTVRVRLSDFTRREAGGPENWYVSGDSSAGVASLDLTGPPLDVAAQATLNFRAGTEKAEFLLRTRPEGVPMHGEAAASSGPATTGEASTLERLGHPDREKAAKIDRVYLGYLPDRSWAKIEVFVTRNNNVYRMKEELYSDDIRWNELELRWPDPDEDSQAGRTYRLLERVTPKGAEIAGPTEPFSVRVVLTPTSGPGAWYAKATRNYRTAFQQVPIARYIMTSAALAILNIVLVVFASSLAAYAFARVEFPGRDVLFGVLLATMMIPGQVTMIPTFLIYKNLGWYNTLLPLWVPSAFGAAFFIFMARQFLKSIPRELEEAARIDGCGFFRIYWHVMLPLIRPTLAAIAMFAFQGAWNNFMGPLIYVNDERMFNLAFGLFKFQLLSGSSNSLMMAGAFVMTLPLIITFFLFQRYFVQGIALSGLGGR